MKACDSWPGNKAEEGHLPKSAHTLRHSDIMHSCMHAGFNTSGACLPRVANKFSRGSVRSF